MKLLRSYLYFCLVVALATTISTIAGIYAIGFIKHMGGMFSSSLGYTLIAALFAAVYGLVFAAIGFWPVYHWRKLFSAGPLSLCVIVGLTAIVFLVMAAMQLQIFSMPRKNPVGELLAFPIVPFLLTSYVFVRMAKKYAKPA